MISIRGIIISRWDDRLGVVLEGAHPKNVADSLNDDDLLTIFSTHAISEKAGVMAMRIKRLNIISYYSGLPEGEKTDQFFVALILEPDEDPNPYEEGLSEIANMIIPTVGKPGFEEFFAESFDRISKYVSISEEQRYSFIFRDNTRRLLLERLANGPMTKEGLAKWLSKEVGEEITDIEGLLSPLRKTELIEEINISKGKKVTLEFVFLIRDVAVIRTPHVKLFNAAKDGQVPGDLRDKYIDETTRFFKEYRITGQDTLIIANAISDPDMYDVIRILREEYVTRAELPMKIGREIPNLDKILRKMAEDHLITAIKDKKERVWVMLLSDIVFPTFFPEYMVDVIRRRWKEGTIQKEIALKHLELLRAEYIATQAPKFRKKLMVTMKDIFKRAELFAQKGAFDESATRLDQVANYCRDMGERQTAEIVDQAAKAMREDKEIYQKEKWEEDRVIILKEFEDIEAKDEAKLAAMKGKKKKKAKPKKSKPVKNAGKTETPAEEPQEEIAREDITLESGLDDSGVHATPGAEVNTDIKSIEKNIKQLSKQGPSEQLIQEIGNLAAAYEALGDKAKMEKAQKAQQTMYIEYLQSLEKQYVTEGKKAMKNKDFENAYQLWSYAYETANSLFKQGMMQYSDIAKKYKKIMVECENNL